MKSLALFAALAILAPILALADATGPACVIDGDTIEIAGERIRLHGIDAPERTQVCHEKNGTPYRCGLLATAALKKLIGGQPLTCQGDARDRYGRLIAVCYLGRTDINEQMVVQGWALAYRKYSTAYVRAEQAAKIFGTGMWKGRFAPNENALGLIEAKGVGGVAGRVRL